MRNPILISTGLALCILLSGCSTVKRYKSASYKGEENQLADIQLFGAKLESEEEKNPGKSLWDLSASAQTQLIQILHERYPENDAFIQAMNRDYLLKGEGPVLDFTKKDLLMVFTVSKVLDASSLGQGLYSPADRIEQLKFSLELPGETGLKFSGWNRYATEFGEIELAEMSFDRSFELEAQAGGEIVEGNMKTGSSRKEGQVLRQSYLKLNGCISDQKLEVEEQGTRESDLAGNVIVEVSLAFEPMAEQVCIPLFEEMVPGKKELSLKFIEVLVPAIESAPEVISANLEMEYIYRHVESGWKTYQEWDDHVAYYKGRVNREVKLFDREDYIPVLYGVGSEENGQRSWLRVRTVDGQEYPLQFMDYDDAVQVFNWLAGKSGSLGRNDSSSVFAGNKIILYGNDTLNSDRIAGAGFKVMTVY